MDWNDDKKLRTKNVKDLRSPKERMQQAAMIRISVKNKKPKTNKQGGMQEF